MQNSWQALAFVLLTASVKKTCRKNSAGFSLDAPSVQALPMRFNGNGNGLVLMMGFSGYGGR